MRVNNIKEYFPEVILTSIPHDNSTKNQCEINY